MLSDNEHATPDVDPFRDWISIFRHPGLVDVIATQRPGERPYLVLALPKGPTMGRIVARRGRYDVADFASIGAQLLGTVSYLHDQGLVVGDLHVDSIHVYGDDPRSARVTVDGVMGCARTHRFTPVSDTDKTCLVLRTDVCRLDPRDDVIALGTVLQSVLALAPNPTDGRDPIRARLHALCERCTAPARERRPADAGELLLAFYACFEAPPTQADPRPWPQTPAVYPPAPSSVTELAMGPMASPVVAPGSAMPPAAVAAAAYPVAVPAVTPPTTGVGQPPAMPLHWPVGSPGLPAPLPPVGPSTPPLSMLPPGNLGPAAGAVARPAPLPRPTPSRFGRMFGLVAAAAVSVGILLAWPRPEVANAQMARTPSGQATKATPSARPAVVGAAPAPKARPTKPEPTCQEPAEVEPTRARASREVAVAPRKRRTKTRNRPSQPRTSTARSTPRATTGSLPFMGVSR